MPINTRYIADFVENKTYHVYNRTNNNEKLFLNDENRVFFLNQYRHYLSPFVDTYCWCLISNHFHLLIKVKDESTIKKQLQDKGKEHLTTIEAKYLKENDGQTFEDSVSFSELIEHGFKRFFQSYALAFNKVNNRKGNLFYKPFKRVLIQKESHFTQSVIYIHTNPLKHNITRDFENYRWSSYKSIISQQQTLLLREEILKWFGNKEQFINAHQSILTNYDADFMMLEDE